MPFALALAVAKPAEDAIAPETPRLIVKAAPDPTDIARTALAALAEAFGEDAPAPPATALPAPDDAEEAAEAPAAAWTPLPAPVEAEEAEEAPCAACSA